MEERQIPEMIELNPELSEEERQEEAAWDAVAIRLMLEAEAEAKRLKTHSKEVIDIGQGCP